MAVDLRKHQWDALEKLSNGKILYGGVGSGKSITAIAYYWVNILGGTLIPFDTGINSTPLVIITTALKRDSLEWDGELSRFGLHKGIQDISIDSWNNISKYEKRKDCFFIFDEQHIVGSGAWVKGFLKIAAANEWILLTATPGDTWMDYVPVFIANGFYKNRSDFYRQHVVFSRFTKYPKVDRYLDTRKLARYRNQILVSMPYEKHTTRHVLEVPVEYDRKLYERIKRKRFNVYTHAPVKDAGELCRVLRRCASDDDRRIDALEEILAENKRVILFYNYNYELQKLEERFEERNDLIFAERNGKRHDPVPKGERWLYVIQYSSGHDGWNCTSTNCVVLFSPTYSYRVDEQAQGRIDRLNTRYMDLYYYRLVAKGSIEDSILDSVKRKEIFNERGYVDSLNADKNV